MPGQVIVFVIENEFFGKRVVAMKNIAVCPYPDMSVAVFVEIFNFSTRQRITAVEFRNKCFDTNAIKPV